MFTAVHCENSQPISDCNEASPCRIFTNGSRSPHAISTIGFVSRPKRGSRCEYVVAYRIVYKD